MKKKKVNINKIKPNYFMFFFTIGLFCLFVVRIIYLCTTDYSVGDSTISAFIKKSYINIAPNMTGAYKRTVKVKDNAFKI